MNSAIMLASAVAGYGLSEKKSPVDESKKGESDQSVANKATLNSRKKPDTSSGGSSWLSWGVKVATYASAAFALYRIGNCIKLIDDRGDGCDIACDSQALCSHFITGVTTVAVMKKLSDTVTAWEEAKTGKSAAKSKYDLLSGTWDRYDPKVLRPAPFSLEALEEMPNLNTLKQKLQSLKTKSLIDSKREEHGCKVVDSPLHMQLLGNPGTGKTMSATIITSFLYEIGAISQNKITFTDRGDLISKWVNDTETQTKAVLKRAKGGVLFIDEAYTLDSGTERYEKDGGHQALAVLLTALEDPRADVVIIFAGYPEKMKKMISTNQGLASRIGHSIHCEDLSADQLVDVFKYTCAKEDYTPSDEALATVKQKLLKLKHCTGEDFGNARSVKAFFHKVIETQGRRLANNIESVDASVLREITVADVEDTSLDELLPEHEQQPSYPTTMYS